MNSNSLHSPKLLLKNAEIFWLMIIKILFVLSVTNSLLKITKLLLLNKEVVKKNNYTHIGRLDAGDICYKNKFFKQLNFLEKNSNIKLVGSWARAVNNLGKLLFHIKHPTNHDEIRKKIYLNSMFVNPTVVFDVSVLETVKEYPREYSYAAHDYAFYFKVVKKH